MTLPLEDVAERRQCLNNEAYFSVLKAFLATGQVSREGKATGAACTLCCCVLGRVGRGQGRGPQGHPQSPGAAGPACCAQHRLPLCSCSQSQMSLVMKLRKELNISNAQHRQWLEELKAAQSAGQLAYM